MNEHYFMVPRHFLARATEAGRAAISVYLQICSQSNTAERYTAISTADLASLAGLTQRSVFSAITRLRELGLIACRKSAQAGMNEYSLAPDEGTLEGANASGDAVSTDPAIPTGQAASTNVEDVQDPKTPQLEAEPPGTDPGRQVTESPNRMESPLALDELIAEVYSSKCHVADLEPYVDLTEADLRSCLEWIRAQGGVDSAMPTEFFAVVLQTAKRKMPP